MALFPLGIKVELLINGTWADVSAYVRQRTTMQITGGRSERADTSQPAQLTLEFDNRDGRFSPYNVSGIYYPYLKRNVQVRVSVTDTSASGNFYSGYRYWGEVHRWPPLNDVSGRDVSVTVTAHGPLRRIRAHGGKGSALTRYYGTLTGSFAPIAYWPCEEDPDTTIIGAGIDGGTNMSVTTGTPKWKHISDFNGSAPIAVINKSTWDGLTGSFGSSGDDVFDTPGTYTWVASTATVDARCWGGGGAGGGCRPAASDGGDGGDSSIAGDSVTVLANGGSGGKNGDTGTGAGGAAGTGSTNTAHHNGGAGAAHNGTGNFTGGGGGGSGGTAAAGNPGSGSSGGAAVTNGGKGGNHAATGGVPGGGGGGAEPGVGTFPAGGGGGGGEEAEETALAVTVGNTYSVVVGAGGQGGAGGTPGANGGGGKVELIYTPQTTATTNVIRFIKLTPKHGGNPGKVLLRALTSSSVLARLDVTYVTGGKLRLQGFNGSSVQQFDSGAQSWGVDGQTIMVSVELQNSGANVAWAFKAVIPGNESLLGSASGTVTTAACGNVSEVIVSPNADITKTALGHISVQYAKVNLLKVSHALHGHHTEMGVDRFIRLLNETAMGNAVEFNETSDHWGFEAGTQSWVGTNCTLASVTTTFTPIDTDTAPLIGLYNTWPPEGTHSLRLTANGAGQPTATSPTGTSGQPVNAGDIVSVNAEIYSAAAKNNVFLGILWYQSNGSAATHAEDDTADTVFAAGQMQTLKMTATAPTGAAFFAVKLGNHNTDANGVTLHADNVRTHPRMGPQTRKDYHKFLEEIHHLDQGIMKEAKELWGLKYRTRFRLINQTPAVTLSYTAGTLSQPLAPVIDDKLTKNDVTVHRHKGSKIRVTLDSGEMSVLEPPAGSGRHRHHLRVAAERDEQLAALAAHLLNLGTGPQERFPTITVNLARAGILNNAVAPLMSAIAAVEIGDMVQLTNLPAWFPNSTAKQLVIGYTETLNAYEWTITWNCIPESQYEIVATAQRRW